MTGMPTDDLEFLRVATPMIVSSVRLAEQNRLDAASLAAIDELYLNLQTLLHPEEEAESRVLRTVTEELRTNGAGVHFVLQLSVRILLRWIAAREAGALTDGEERVLREYEKARDDFLNSKGVT